MKTNADHPAAAAAAAAAGDMAQATLNGPLNLNFFCTLIVVVLRRNRDCRDDFRAAQDGSAAEERGKEEGKAGEVPAEEGDGGQEEDAAGHRGKTSLKLETGVRGGGGEGRRWCSRATCEVFSNRQIGPGHLHIFIVFF